MAVVLDEVPFPEVWCWDLELPYTKPPLSMNGRTHWRAKHNVKADLKDNVKWLARIAKLPRCERARIELHYVPADNRRRDPLNLTETLKVCEDALVEFGLIPDDSMQAGHVPVIPTIHPKGPLRPGRNRLWLHVTRLR